MKVFKNYSAYYDLLYKDKDYKGEAEYIHELINSSAPEANSILDLGCGTGKHAFHFAELGYEVDGIDFSDSMVEIANKNLDSDYQEHKDKLSFQVGDVQDFRGQKKYDVVVSLFHVMSYQTTNEALKATFETAKTHLKEDGILIFDFWYGPGVLTDPPVVRVKRLEDEHIHVTRIAEPVMHPNDNCVDVNYAIFIKDKATGEVEQIEETHKMRYLFIPEMLNLSDFSLIDYYAWRSFDKPTFKSWNSILIFRK